jgi:hypothetical protein
MEAIPPSLVTFCDPDSVQLDLIARQPGHSMRTSFYRRCRVIASDEADVQLNAAFRRMRRQNL